jgi:hypothetical protein
MLREKKTTSDDFSERFLPWMGNISDTSIISVTSGLSNTVFFNRAHPVFSARYRYSDHILKALLLNGFETRRTQLNELHCIWNATKSFGIEMEWKNGTVMNNSDVSFQKNYTILMNEFSPVFNLQPSVKQRYSFVSRYRISESQTTPTITRAVIFSAGPDIRIPVFDKHTINFKFLYHQITYSGPSNSALSYELLNSLEPGRNFTWNLMLQLSVSKAFMLNFMYEGRLPQNRKTIHFGSVQLKALL